MPRRSPPQISVGPRPGGRWAIQKDGTSRASKLFDTKKPAVDRARAQARREGVELVIKDRKGSVQSEDSHGRDRRNRRG